MCPRRGWAGGEEEAECRPWRRGRRARRGPGTRGGRSGSWGPRRGGEEEVHKAVRLLQTKAEEPECVSSGGCSRKKKRSCRCRGLFRVHKSSISGQQKSIQQESDEREGRGSRHHEDPLPARPTTHAHSRGKRKLLFTPDVEEEVVTKQRPPVGGLIDMKFSCCCTRRKYESQDTLTRARETNAPPSA